MFYLPLKSHVHRENYFSKIIIPFELRSFFDHSHDIHYRLRDILCRNEVNSKIQSSTALNLLKTRFKIYLSFPRFIHDNFTLKNSERDLGVSSRNVDNYNNSLI